VDFDTSLVAAYCTSDDATKGMLHGVRLRQGGPAPLLHGKLLRNGVPLIAPFQTAKYEKTPWPHWLVERRRRIETVLAQPVERHNRKRTWTQNLWHLCSRWLRKILSHTMSMLLCQQHGLGSLSFEQLVASRKTCTPRSSGLRWGNPKERIGRHELTGHVAIEQVAERAKSGALPGR
jgi:hypothetical protein